MCAAFGFGSPKFLVDAIRRVAESDGGALTLEAVGVAGTDTRMLCWMLKQIYNGGVAPCRVTVEMHEGKVFAAAAGDYAEFADLVLQLEDGYVELDDGRQQGVSLHNIDPLELAEFVLAAGDDNVELHAARMRAVGLA